MLTTVEARNKAGALLTLPLEDVSDGLIINDISGLDPVKATVVTSSFATMDGVQFQSSRREARNIVIKLDLEPDYATDTVQSLRERLYAYFMTKASVSLRFIDSGGREVDVDGWVESCGAPLFTSEPQVQISVICPNPDFVDMTPVEISGNTVSSTVETLVEYEGTVETGMIFTLSVDRDFDEFTIYHRGPDNVTSAFDFSASLLDGDVLTINSVPGSRGVTLLRGGTTSSLLYGKSVQSLFDNLQLEPGDNYIRFYATGDPIPFEMTYLKRYGGL